MSAAAALGHRRRPRRVDCTRGGPVLDPPLSCGSARLELDPARIGEPGTRPRPRRDRARRRPWRPSRRRAAAWSSSVSRSGWLWNSDTDDLRRIRRRVEDQRAALGRAIGHALDRLADRLDQLLLGAGDDARRGPAARAPGRRRRRCRRCRRRTPPRRAPWPERPATWKMTSASCADHLLGQRRARGRVVEGRGDVLGHVRDQHLDVRVHRLRAVHRSRRCRP